MQIALSWKVTRKAVGLYLTENLERRLILQVCSVCTVKFGGRLLLLGKYIRCKIYQEQETYE